MFLASKSCLLNLQYFVTSLTSEQQLCRIFPSYGLQHFRGSFLINKSLVATPSPGAGQRRCIGWNIQPQSLGNVGSNLLTILSFHISRVYPVSDNVFRWLTQATSPQPKASGEKVKDKKSERWKKADPVSKLARLQLKAQNCLFWCFLNRKFM